MFPFGIQPEASDPNRDERGPDTMNRLLLHGARYHDRKALFVSPAGRETADWEADRTSLRLALALAREHDVRPGDVVGLFLPLSVEWALVERAIWSLGATSAPIASETEPTETSRILSDRHAKLVFAARAFDPAGSTTPVVALDSAKASGSFAHLVSAGGALDTPERASRHRAFARDAMPFGLASIEPDGSELAHESWVLRVRRRLESYPPRRGERCALTASTADLPSRVALYAGWADGLTTVVVKRLMEPFARGGIGSGRSANLSADGGTDA